MKPGDAGKFAGPALLVAALGGAAWLAWKLFGGLRQLNTPRVGAGRTMGDPTDERGVIVGSEPPVLREADVAPGSALSQMLRIELSPLSVTSALVGGVRTPMLLVRGRNISDGVWTTTAKAMVKPLSGVYGAADFSTGEVDVRFAAREEKEFQIPLDKELGAVTTPWASYNVDLYTDGRPNNLGTTLS